MSPGALSHFRILDLTQELGYASKLFADLGSDVVLIEPPEGIEARRRTPYLDGVAGPESSLHFQYLSSGKRSVTADLRDPHDLDFIRRLIAAADIVLDDQLAPVRHAHGLAYEDLALANPGLVWCSVTPFGQTGPRASERGDPFTAMAAGGMAWLTGYEDDGPLVADGDLPLYSAAQYAAVMSLVAALGREHVGGGQFIDVSVQEVVALGTETAPQFFDLKGVLRRRLGEHERQAGIGIYPCLDGDVLLYAADSGLGTGWSNLVQWLADAQTPGVERLCGPEWLDNGFKAQPEGRSVFREVFTYFARDRGKQSLFEEGQARHIAIAPVNDSAGVLADPHLHACGSLVRVGEIQGREIVGPGAPYRLSRTPWRAGGRAPFLGEHTAELRKFCTAAVA